MFHDLNLFGGKWKDFSLYGGLQWAWQQVCEVVELVRVLIVNGLEGLRPDVLRGLIFWPHRKIYILKRARGRFLGTIGNEFATISTQTFIQSLGVSYGRKNIRSV
jgi:hypothetical protein